jgi:hypothetical protein
MRSLMGARPSSSAFCCRDLLQGFVEAVSAFDNGGRVGLLARHEVVDREAKGEARGEIVGTGVEK